MLAETDWGTLVTDPIRDMLSQILSYLPVLLGALLILIVGWLVAKAFRRIAEWLLKTIHFEELANKAGITSALKKGNLEMTISQILCSLVYWLIMIIVLVMVVNALGLSDVSRILASLFTYVPQVIAALVVLVVAIFLGGVVSGIVRTAAANASLPGPEMLAGLSRWAIIIFGVTIALAQLGIAPVLITTSFNILLGGVVLALALAFGLGGRDAAARYLDDLQKKQPSKKEGEKS